MVVNAAPMAVLSADVPANLPNATPPPKSGVGSGGGVGFGPGDGRPQQPIGGAVLNGRAISPAEQKFQAALQKLQPRVAAVVTRLKNSNSSPSADESKFVRNGKAEIQVWLSDKSDETMAKLKELGFEIILNPKTAKMVIGRLPIEKLATLAELESVRYVAPQTSN
jgi:hypothetical protein